MVDEEEVTTMSENCTCEKPKPYYSESGNLMRCANCGQPIPKEKKIEALLSNLSEDNIKTIFTEAPTNIIFKGPHWQWLGILLQELYPFTTETKEVDEELRFKIMKVLRYSKSVWKKSNKKELALKLIDEIKEWDQMREVFVVFLDDGSNAKKNTGLQFFSKDDAEAFRSIIDFIIRRGGIQDGNYLKTDIQSYKTHIRDPTILTEK
jgi:hypothetical protein